MSVSSRTKRTAGFTATEVTVALVIVAVLGTLAIPALNRAQESQSLKDSAITMKGALEYARSEAIRSGNIHIVFFEKDAEGQPLKDANDQPVPALVLDDGRAGTPNQNCKIDDGEPILPIHLESGVIGGVSSGAAALPSDQGAGSISSGSSFTDPAGNQAFWVLFRPEGTPRSFDVNCNIGGVGSGAGAFYLTNGDRTSAVSVTPMGAGRLYSWSDGWSH